MIRLCATLFGLAALLLSPAFSAVPRAHPNSPAFVVVELRGNFSISVEISAEPGILARTLEGLTGRVAPLHARASDIVQMADLEADGRRVALAWSGVEPAAHRTGLVTVRLSGELPADAVTVRWRSDLLLGAYPLAVVRTRSEIDLDSYEWLAGRAWSRQYPIADVRAANGGNVVPSAIRLIPQGFTHILPAGLDHVLFMLGLYLAGTTRRAVILQVSLFTLAHSVTLALGVIGWVSVPERIVEPLIALSIAFIAVENLLGRSLSRGRLIAVFCFGLLHGLGFAGAMADIGLSGEHLAGALVGFNIGVELGQLAVIAGAALIVRSLRLSIDMHRQFVVRPVSAAIALAGLFWMVERTM